MERHRRLARSRPAGDDEHPGQVGADGLILFGLDRRNDVAHPAGAVAFERGEQRAFTGDLQTGVGDRLLVEDLVVEAGDLTTLLREQMAAAHDPHRGDGGRPVERFGDRGPPVDHEWRVLSVLDRQAPDVPAGDVLHVEPSEHERRVTDVEVGETSLRHVPGDVALEAGLVRAAGPNVRIRGAHPFRGLAHRLQTGVGSVDVGLFGLELRIVRPRIVLGALRHHAPSMARSAFADGPA